MCRVRVVTNTSRKAVVGVAGSVISGSEVGPMRFGPETLNACNEHRRRNSSQTRLASSNSLGQVTKTLHLPSCASSSSTWIRKTCLSPHSKPRAQKRLSVSSSGSVSCGANAISSALNAAKGCAQAHTPSIRATREAFPAPKRCASKPRTA